MAGEHLGGGQEAFAIPCLALGLAAALGRLESVAHAFPGTSPIMAAVGELVVGGLLASGGKTLLHFVLARELWDRGCIAGRRLRRKVA